MATPLESFLSGVQASQAMKQARQTINDQQQLRTLAPQVVAGDTQAFNQAAAIDPKQAASLQGAGDSQYNRLDGAIKLIDSAQTPEQKENAYQQVRPYLAQFGQEPPATFAEAAPQFEQAKVRIAIAKQGSGQDLKSLRVGQDGYYYAIQGGQLVNTGIQADPKTQLRDQVGIAPSVVNLRTGVASPLQAAGSQGSSVPNSPQGAYIDPSLPPQVQQQIQQSLANGQEPPSQMAFNGSAPQSGLVAPRQDPSQQITPYQQAQLGMSAEAQRRQDEQLELARRAADRADSADARAERAAQTKDSSNGIKAVQLQNVTRGIDRIDSALKAFDGSLADTGPVDQLYQRYTPKGQELEAAVGGIQNSLLALTRVPGIGSQSDLEARIANQQYPSLDKSPEVNRRTLANLKQFAQELGEVIDARVQQSGLQTSSRVVDGPSSTAPVRRARNPQTGETLILVNGQWVPENGR